ncbi:MAG: type III pantothenate kinase [Deltaproteobacteria bacterium]|nr:type III pantothenate kinase [Deltaproteobacteria bacterium]
MSPIERPESRGDKLLVIDVGNTNTVLGLYQGETLEEHWRIATNPQTTTDELGVLYRALFSAVDLRPEVVGAAIVSSVVPPIDHAVRRACRRYFGVEAEFVGPGSDLGIGVRYDNPLEVGADRLVNAVAAFARYHSPCIIIDFGTATTFDVVDAEGTYLGGVISPGLGVSLDALIARAAKLPKVEIRKPDSIMGTNTISAIQAGTVYGYVGLVDGIVRRILDAYPDLNFRIIGTGGLAGLIGQESAFIELVEPFLTLEGLRLIHERRAQA